MTSMDWYLGNEINDFVVPNNQDLEDEFTSQENWSKWGASSSPFGNMESPNKCSTLNTNMAPEEVDYQLDELSRFQQTDNIFWNSMIEDLQGNEEPDFFSVPSERNHHFSSAEPSLEQSVLQELETAMTQLPDETRFCFRDAFYRLAKSSEESLMQQNQTSEASFNGSDRMNGMEERTNTIDRAIASMTFNKMESNIMDFHLMDQMMSDGSGSSSNQN